MKTPRGPWITDLSKKGIILTDSVSHTSLEVDPEIHLLIGADVAGKLLNGKLEILADGPVAVGTHLGWTVMGRTKGERGDGTIDLTIISMLAREISETDVDVIESKIKLRNYQDGRRRSCQAALFENAQETS